MPVWLKGSHVSMGELIIHEARHEGEYPEDPNEMTIKNGAAPPPGFL